MSRTLRIGLLAYLVLGAVCAALVLHERGDFSDLDVYRWATGVAFNSGDLYDLANPASGLRFTYTPFAAVLFTASEHAYLLEPVVLTSLSLVALARTSLLLARHRGTLFPNLSVAWAAIFIAASMLLLEPTSGTLLLGQINLILLWLVCEDLLCDERRWSGVLTGLAAAIKLTPAMYLVFAATIGRWRTVLVGGATIAATILLGWVLLPTESRTFWSGTGADASRVGHPEYAPNQSINGVIWRLGGPGGNDMLWVTLAIVAVIGCLWLARRFDHARERATALGLASLAGLLASPVSWNHHWVALAPLFVGLLGASRAVTVVRSLTLVAGGILASRVIWRVPSLNGVEFDHTVLQSVAASAYPIAGVLLISAAWIARPRVIAVAGTGQPEPA